MRALDTDASLGLARPSALPRAPMRVLGPVIVARQLSPWSLRRQAGRGRSDALALCLLSRPTVWRVDAVDLLCPAGSGLLIDLSNSSEAACAGDPGLVLLVPRRLLPALGRGRVTADRVPRSAALGAVRKLAATLLERDVPLTEAQARLAGRALGELMTVALAPLARVTASLEPRREGALLDRLVAHVDADLAADLGAEALCEMLHCSRTALYRATSAVGGVAALVAQRRLAAVHDRLCDPAERRGIAELARAHGLGDPAQFSRVFKRRYGLTAADLRRASHAPHGTAAQ